MGKNNERTMTAGDCSGLPGADSLQGLGPAGGRGTGGERCVQQKKHGVGLKGDL